MSKLKFSFSLLITILLVGILSTAAFAKDPYGLKPVSQSDLSLLVPFTGNSADATDVQGRSFDVVLIGTDGTTVVDTYTGTLGSDLKGSVTVPAGVMTPGSIYTVKLYHTDDTAHATLLSKSSAVVYDPDNGSLLNGDNGATKVGKDQTVTLDKNGTGLKNANLTGFNNTRKNRSGQKVHGFYQNNTNSCASCHQTHTAANGESLLFKDGVYSTCSACHDGTTGAYNSFAPISASMTSSISGTFNVQAGGHNGSLHEADGSLEVKAAPGGNRNGGQYAAEFDCASCHAAHGSGSAGENNLNTDPMGWGSTPYAATAGQSITYVKGHGTATITTTVDNKNGKLFTFAKSDIIDLNNGGTIPTTETFPYILVKTTATADNVVLNNTNKDTKAAFNFFWSRAKVPAGALVIQTYRWAGESAGTTGGYVPDYSLWNREEGYPYVANTVLKDNADKSLNMDANLQIVWRDGFAYGSSVANVDHAVVSVGIDVETTDNIATLYDSTATGYVPDSGTEMSKYCASCHIDYASRTRTDNTGVYTTAHRHATLQDRLTCVRCHYGHGSEAQIMHDANDNTYYTLTGAGNVFDANVAGNTDKAISYFADPNPSSALKRYTGMSVCYACHGQGEQFLGNPNTNKADKTTGEFLKGGEPGATDGTATGRTDISK